MQIAFMVAPNVTVRAKNIYSTKCITFCFRIYFLCIFLEYLIMFFTVPTEPVVNRPASCVNSGILTLYTVIVSLVLLPFGIVDLPTSASYRSHVIATVLHSISLIVNIGSTVSLFKVKEPLLIVFHPDNKVLKSSVDATMYFRILAIILLTLITLSLLTSLASAIISGLALYRIANRMSRSGKRQDLSNIMSRQFHNGEHLKCKEDFTGNEIHDEITQKIKAAFT